MTASGHQQQHRQNPMEEKNVALIKLKSHFCVACLFNVHCFHVNSPRCCRLLLFILFYFILFCLLFTVYSFSLFLCFLAVSVDLNIFFCSQNQKAIFRVYSNIIPFSVLHFRHRNKNKQTEQKNETEKMLDYYSFTLGSSFFYSIYCV